MQESLSHSLKRGQLELEVAQKQFQLMPEDESNTVPCNSQICKRRFLEPGRKNLYHVIPGC